MPSQWAVLNSIAEKDDDADPEYPWYPYLFSEGLGFSLSVSFSTEAQCRDFIEKCVLGATLEDL